MAVLRFRMPVIETSGLTKVYRTYRKESGLWGAVKGLVKRRYEETRAADNISFSIEEGELVGFLGPNGAGKTTVLKCSPGCSIPLPVRRACSALSRGNGTMR
jgi:ABC-2 type transport system ATP-binding protein